MNIIQYVYSMVMAKTPWVKDLLFFHLTVRYGTDGSLSTFVLDRWKTPIKMSYYPPIAQAVCVCLKVRKKIIYINTHTTSFTTSVS